MGIDINKLVREKMAADGYDPETRKTSNSGEASPQPETQIQESQNAPAGENTENVTQQEGGYEDILGIEESGEAAPVEADVADKAETKEDDTVISAGTSDMSVEERH